MLSWKSVGGEEQSITKTEEYYPMSNNNNITSKCPIDLDILIDKNFDIMHSDILHIKEKQSEGFQDLKSSINELQNTIMNPETGIYSRLIQIEKTKDNFVKWVWGIVFTLSGAGVTGLIKLLF